MWKDFLIMTGIAAVCIVLGILFIKPVKTEDRTIEPGALEELLGFLFIGGGLAFLIPPIFYLISLTRM